MDRTSGFSLLNNNYSGTDRFVLIADFCLQLTFNIYLGIKQVAWINEDSFNELLFADVSIFIFKRFFFKQCVVLVFVTLLHAEVVAFME